MPALLRSCPEAQSLRIKASLVHVCSSADPGRVQGVWGPEHQELSGDEKKSLYQTLQALQTSADSSSLLASWQAARKTLSS